MITLIGIFTTLYVGRKLYKSCEHQRMQSLYFNSMLAGEEYTETEHRQIAQWFKET